MINSLVLDHYTRVWNNTPTIKSWDKGPIEQLPDDFRVLEFKPTENRNMWTYATMGMSNMSIEEPIELHIFSKNRDNTLIELLTIVAHYHNNGSNLSLNHTVNFGKSWQFDSICTHGLISLPYLDGPKLENLYIPEYDENLKFLWLIPVTQDEVDFKNKNGINALEEKFDTENFNYLDYNRNSVLNKRKNIFGF